MSPPSKPPPSSAIPGKSSNSGPYLAGIVILLLAAIGLFVWKTNQSTPTATIQSATVVATSAEPPPPPPLLYALPPPPKLDDEPDAGADAGQQPLVKGTGTLGPAGGPCGSTCSGVETPDLKAKLRGAAQSAQGCYNRALRTSEASGKLVVSVKLSATGSVCGASITSDEVHSPEISNCVLNKFRTTQFPAPSGGCATANIPISFSIKQ